MRKIWITIPLLAGCASMGGNEGEEQLVARARAIHERVITMDSHDDIPFNFATPDYNACNALNRQVDVPKMRAGGLDVAFFIVYVGQGPRTAEGNARAHEQAMNKFNAIHRMAEKDCPDQIQIAYTPDDVERIAKSGKLATVIGIENGYVIGNDISLIKKYYDLGGRYMTLAHTTHNDIADSSNPPQGEHGGLSPLGEKVVAELNRVGMMVDVSHVSKEAMLDAIRISKAPVIGSHSSTRKLANVPRNMDDEALLALKKNGGVMQTVALDGYVKVPAPEKAAAIRELRTEFGITGGGGGAALQALTSARRAEYQAKLAEIEKKWPRATVEDFVNHIDHAVLLIGIDHVGISSDFDGGGGVTGWANAGESFNVTLALVRRGYSEEDIAKLWGGNLLRVWREAQRVARSMS